MGNVPALGPEDRVPTDTPVSQDDVRVALLRQVLASRSFQKSPRLTKFLQFICLRLMGGRSHEINEQQIGIHVFGRSEMYNTADDSVVRVQARLLRQRLEEFFQHECPQTPLIITIPKGSYVPLFVARNVDARPVPPPQASLPAGDEAAVISPAGSGVLAAPGVAWKWVALCFLVLAGFLLSSFWKNPGRTPAAPLWSQFFTPGSTVIIVPSDDALELFQEFTGKSVQLNEYLSGSYLSQANSLTVGRFPLSAEWFTDHQFTSSADLGLALRLGRLPEAQKVNLETKNARSLGTADLKGRNIVLIGGVVSNPWVELFANRLNFDINVDHETIEAHVVNKHPRSDEKPVYREDFFSKPRRSYGLFAYLPGIDGDGEVLLFEGTDMAGTESAADFPFSAALFRSFATTIGATAGHVPYFEVLLETTGEGGNAPEAHVVTYRLIQP
jgi:hypothetical protein